MKKPILAAACYFTILLYITACGKKEATPTLEGIYDIIYYSVDNCGAEENFTIDKEEAPCSTVGTYEICLNGTISFTSNIFTLDLQLTVDGERDGEKVEHPYMVEGNQLSICTTPSTCNMATINLMNGIVEIISNNEDNCSGVIRGRKR